MAKTRIWKLQLNLEVFNLAVASLGSEAEHADFLKGMWRGVNNWTLPDDAVDSFADGYEFGLSMRGEAEAYREQAKKDGVKGGYRKHKSSPPSRVPSSPPSSNPITEQPSCSTPKTREFPSREDRVYHPF